MDETEITELKSGMKTAGSRDKIYYYIPALLAIILVHLALQPIDGSIGHDFYHYESRTLFGLVHFYRNFLEIPHYNPYLCGGIPYFADPQCYYYSFPQLFSLFVDPYHAFLLTVFLFNIIAYFSSIAFFRRILHVDTRVAHLCSLIFILNGFSFANFFAGHVTHHSFLLFPLVLFLLFYGSSNIIKGSVFMSLVICYMYYSGGLHVMVVLFFTGILILPYLVYVNHRDKKLKGFFQFFAITAFLLVIGCCGKFIAGALYSRIFITRGVDHPDENIFVFITRYFWFLPGVMPDVDEIHASGAFYGAWEFIGFISKIVLLGLIGILLKMILNFDKKRILFYVINILVIAFVMSLGYGAPFNDFLPFFRGYHNAMKLLGAFIPFFIIITGFGLTFLFKNKFMDNKIVSLIVFFILCTAILFEYRIYTGYFIERGIGITRIYNTEIYNRIRKEKKAAPVNRIIDKTECDITAFSEGTSSLDAYESNFGYGRETLGALGILKKDSIYITEDGYYNMTHPGSLVYPEFFGLDPWTRIPMLDREKMENFIMAKCPNFEVPCWQSIIIYINAAILFFLTVRSMCFIIQSIRKKATARFTKRE